jgi:hypothetical protein
MEINIEQVERLMERANVSYEEAKVALEESGGNLLDALILLERKGKTRRQSSSYSTGGATPSPQDFDANKQYEGATGGSARDNTWKANTSGFGEAMGKLANWLLALLRKSAINSFEVYHRGESVFCVPVIILILLLICFFWITLPVMVVALFFGCRYRFNGPDLGKESINRAMDSAADAAEDLKQTVKETDENRHDG